MPKIIQAKEYDQITDAVGRFPDGATLDGIAATLGHELSQRTLQRRLAELIANGRVQGSRARRSFKYRIAPTPSGLAVREEPLRAQAPHEDYVPLSPDSLEVKAYVRRPIQGRRPVGYQQEFLEDYRPNATFYLPEGLRSQLQAMGRSPAANAPTGSFARAILSRLLIDLSWASSHLEGNTYDLLDTERLIRFGEAAAGKDALETQMILNHKAAIEYLVHGADRVDVNAETIIALHGMLSDGLLSNPMACGQLRDCLIGIGGSVYLPIGLPARVAELFKIVIGMANQIDDPFEQSFFLMVHLPYLQPFQDVNKRVSRLAANIPLIKRNLSPLSFVDVPERAYVDGLLGVYELTRVDLLRDVFVWAYERSCHRYVAIEQQLVPPDAFRLRHRLALAEVVRTVVRGGLLATEDVIRRSMPLTVPVDEQEAFVRLVIKEFVTLHAGNAIRFGIRPLEFEGWVGASTRS
jgi:hypothetical protein